MSTAVEHGHAGEHGHPTARGVAKLGLAKVFPVLLQREWWEHRGGFFWAPVIAGAIFLIFTAMVIVVGQVGAGRAGFEIGNFPVDQMMGSLTATQRLAAGAAIDGILYGAAGIIAVVLGFVAFFYCLSALYDERRDRSVLFWKSLPVSDTQTVLSKGVSALLVAPLMNLAAGIVTGIGLLLLMSLFAVIHGINPVMVWTLSSPLQVVAKLVAMLPLYMIWALPTVGWLLLCSAWARSKPFLWAVGLPVGAGMLVSWFGLLQTLTIPDSWFWSHVVGRLLLGTFPGGWINQMNLSGLENVESPDQLIGAFSLGNMYSVLGSAEIWIGAVAGIAMIALAIRLRRWRDDS